MSSSSISTPNLRFCLRSRSLSHSSLIPFVPRRLCSRSTRASLFDGVDVKEPLRPQPCCGIRSTTSSSSALGLSGSAQLGNFCSDRTCPSPSWMPAFPFWRNWCRAGIYLDGAQNA
ncbi:hypothetical protein HPP92_002745 [Vanilla planifolia]|uniref:Uncharacterized protein n=1 Tax=Vanilla planifolia TaxID=51239 RepID=A0A835VET1_VANPL|nr:hypothetical protein HPP92_002745 [Vanilla planifolia]